MSTPSRANREGDSQQLPHPSSAPIAHEMVTQDLLNADAWGVGECPPSLREFYTELQRGAFMLKGELMAPFGPECVDQINRDLSARLALGIERYGEPLRPFNGRNAVLDALEEVYDALAYLRCAIYEVEHSDEAPETLIPWDQIDGASGGNNHGAEETDIEVLQHMAETDAEPVRRAEP